MRKNLALIFLKSSSSFAPEGGFSPAMLKKAPPTVLFRHHVQ